MKHPIFVRPLTDAEREAVEVGLRSAEAVTLRRSQIVRASAHGETVPQIACHLHCNEQTVRNAIHAFNRCGPAALTRGSARPHTPQAAFTPAAAEQLRALLPRSPRDFGYPTSLWTLELAAEVAPQQGLTPERVTGETIRATRARLGVRWVRAKHRITSPDPAYERKKAARPADPPDDAPPQLAPRVRGRDMVESPGAARRPPLDGGRPTPAAGGTGGRTG
jgi:transposase